MFACKNFVDRIDNEIRLGNRATVDFLDATEFWNRMTGSKVVPSAYSRQVACKYMKVMIDEQYPDNDYFEWCKENPNKDLLIEVVEQEKLETGDTYEVTFEMRYNSRFRQYQFAVNEA